MTGWRLGIAGLGLIGGSIALRARAAGAWVCGYDRDADALRLARERGALDAVASGLPELAASCDLLIVALPVDATLDALALLAGIDGPPLIIDVASVKAPFERIAAQLPAYVGTHPMAGRERGGFASADSRLFESASWAYVPHADGAAVARVRAFITAMGALPFEIDAARHDAIVALTSHLPQALSVALASELAAELEISPDVTELCGPGMMSMVRLARSPVDLWLPIVRANAAPLATRLRSIAAKLVATAESLDRGDREPLMSYFDHARIATDALDERFPSKSRS